MFSAYKRSWNALPTVLRGFCIGSMVLTLAALVARLVCVHLLHLYGYPYAYYLLPPSGDGIDVTIFFVRFKQFHSTQFFAASGGTPWQYPAGVAPFYWLLYRVHHGVELFLLTGVSSVLTLAWLLVRALRRHSLTKSSAVIFVSMSLLFSYAFYFEFTRANLELFAWMLAATGVYAVVRNRPWLGAALIGIAGSMKLYPFLYVGLLVARRQYRQAVFAFIVGGAWTLFSLWAICPDLRVAWQGVQSGVHLFSTTYVIYYWPGFAGVDHSLFGLIKRVIGTRPREEYAYLLTAYLAVGAVAGLAIFWGRVRRLPVINQVLILSVSCILLPPLSFDYTLLHLYTAWALLVMLAVDAYHARRHVPGLKAVFACLTVLLSQIGEIFFQGDRLGGPIKAVVLLVLLVLALRYPFEDTQTDTPRDAQLQVPSEA